MRPDSPLDQFDEFDPRAHYAPTLPHAQLTEAERNAARGTEAGTEHAPATVEPAAEPAADPDAVSLDKPPDAP